MVYARIRSDDVPFNASVEIGYEGQISAKAHAACEGVRYVEGKIEDGIIKIDFQRKTKSGYPSVVEGDL